MTKKKKTTEEVIEDDVKVDEAVEEIIDAVKEKTPEDIILELEEKIKELQNTLLKEKADLENTKKRLEKERVIERKYAAMNISRHLLTPLDNYDLALKHKVTDEESEKIFQGFKMIKDQFNKALE